MTMRMVVDLPDPCETNGRWHIAMSVHADSGFQMGMYVLRSPRSCARSRRCRTNIPTG